MPPTRREFLLTCAAASAFGAEMRQVPTLDVRAWRKHFPALDTSPTDPALVYLDSAATTLRPATVIEAVSTFYRRHNANPSATGHSLAKKAQEIYDEARTAVARFLDARDPGEVVFTRGTTEAINLVASAWGATNLGPGDEIVLTLAEHYSNLLPWRIAAERAGARVHYVDVDDQGALRLDHLERLLSKRTKLVAVSHVSNVLGLVNPVKEIAERAHSSGALLLVDGAQSAPHLPIDVQALGCDFFAFSGHKMLGPMGVGVLWARREILDAMPPYQVGSNMAHDVERDGPLHWSDGAQKFQAGTPNVSGPVGLAAALQFYTEIGRASIRAHEQTLVRRTLARFREVPGLRLFGVTHSMERLPVFTFTLKDVPVPRIVQALDARGIAVRGGEMAALPLLKRFGETAAVRASCFLYTTTEEIDVLVDTLVRVTA